MKKQRILFVCEIAVFSALALVFDLFSSQFLKFSWLQGGSISIAMLPIFLMSYKWKAKGGFLIGLIVGSVQVIWGASYIINPIQVLLDYILAYGILGISGLIWKNISSYKGFKHILFIILGIVISCTFRLVFATLSGFLYWGTALIPSLIYNLTYILGSLILCIILMIALTKALKNYLSI